MFLLYFDAMLIQYVTDTLKKTWKQKLHKKLYLPSGATSPLKMPGVQDGLIP